MRTIIRAYSLTGGTSEFGYPEVGGYDTISKILADYVRTGIQDLHKRSSPLHNCHSFQYYSTSSSSIILNCQVKQIIVQDGRVLGMLTSQNQFIESKCIVFSFPSCIAISQLFAEKEDEIFDKEFVKMVSDLDKTTSEIEVHFRVAENVDK